MNHRAYSLLRVRSVDDELREITGIATTPQVDRMGDIVEPLGMRYRVPLPLLLNHNHSQPVGQAYFQRATKDGIPFSARLPKVDDPGIVKDRIDEAWHSLKHKLLGAVSVGFSVDEYEPMENGGTRFTKTECLELSLCAIPANPGAVITGVKAFDTELHAVYRRLPATFAEIQRRFDEAEDRDDADAMAELLNDANFRDATVSHEASKLSAEMKGESAMKVACKALMSATIDNVINDLCFRAHRTRRRVLEKRITALEEAQRSKSATGIVYRGVFEKGSTYFPGDIATHGGTLWFCHAQTTERPGTESWQLMVKTR